MPAVGVLWLRAGRRTPPWPEWTGFPRAVRSEAGARVPAHLVGSEAGPEARSLGGFRHTDAFEYTLFAELRQSH